MTCRKTRRKRFEFPDELGLDAICELCYEEADSVRHLMTLILEPSGEGRKPGTSDFYAWLDARGFRDEWKRSVEIKPEMPEDEA
jgi:hypothetical protein